MPKEKIVVVDNTGKDIGEFIRGILINCAKTDTPISDELSDLFFLRKLTQQDGTKVVSIEWM